jgi:hypothetical protein
MVAKLVAYLDIGLVFRMNGRVYELFGAHSNVWSIRTTVETYRTEVKRESISFLFQCSSHFQVIIRYLFNCEFHHTVYFWRTTPPFHQSVTSNSSKQISRHSSGKPFFKRLRWGGGVGSSVWDVMDTEIPKWLIVFVSISSYAAFSIFFLECYFQLHYRLLFNTRKLLADSGIDFDVSTWGHYIDFFKGHMVCLSQIVIYVARADSQFVWHFQHHMFDVLVFHLFTSRMSTYEQIWLTSKWFAWLHTDDHSLPSYSLI